jgi:hypothetical protein
MDSQFEDLVFEPSPAQAFIRQKVQEDPRRLLQNPAFFAIEQGSRMSRQQNAFFERMIKY